MYNRRKEFDLYQASYDDCLRERPRWVVVLAKKDEQQEDKIREIYKKYEIPAELVFIYGKKTAR